MDDDQLFANLVNIGSNGKEDTDKVIKTVRIIFDERADSGAIAAIIASDIEENDAKASEAAKAADTNRSSKGILKPMTSKADIDTRADEVSAAAEEELEFVRKAEELAKELADELAEDARKAKELDEAARELEKLANEWLEAYIITFRSEAFKTEGDNLRQLADEEVVKVKAAASLTLEEKQNMSLGKKILMRLKRLGCHVDDCSETRVIGLLFCARHKNWSEETRCLQKYCSWYRSYAKNFCPNHDSRPECKVAGCMQKASNNCSECFSHRNGYIRK